MPKTNSSGEALSRGAENLFGKPFQVAGNALVDIFTFKNPFNRIKQGTREGLGEVLATPGRIFWHSGVERIGRWTKNAAMAVLETPIPVGKR
ncbi:hypothetical protein CL635_00040 [bacterium]|jgi:hypothetical protein|nr:hypothetical protein [bacterium]|tara:strand:- start:3592 stop:3867 length:276 start_codon:yes stop_codon:yes gene_type:complete